MNIVIIILDTYAIKNQQLCSQQSLHQMISSLSFVQYYDIDYISSKKKKKATAVQPTKNTSDDDSRARHGFRAQALHDQ